MRYILEIENPENVRVLVMQDLKELGIKVPKVKKNKAKEESMSASNNGSHTVFGNFLNLVPCLMVDECGPVPKFLVQATHILDKHIDIEGLFRKSGSVARQKELKSKIEAGEDVFEANPLDIASLIKQFFRELPDPLFTSRLHDTFIKCHNLNSEDARVTAILLLCHQMPWHHLSTLRYVMLFLQKVAHNCDLNKMDIANLAVCLTPNLMHNNLPGKSDKINTEGRLLQIQTNIVQMLMLWAGDIGMVPDSLYERSALMSACFPTDDELEKSEAHVQEQSKTKGKKKRRSGSLQGLVSNLSSSFTKWRKDSKAHNASSISDRSTMSYLSFEKSSVMSVDQTDMSRLTLPPGGSLPDEYMDPAFLEATPKVIRKRKAEDDAVPFSASKKKAILQHMPQMSALSNTPFTPASHRGRYPGDFQETPNIKFVDSNHMIFSANATPNMQTPKRKMDKLFSPYSSTKVKRQSSGKSSCFSPKTSKSNVRKSVRGFFRRLSGGKEPQPSPSGSTGYSEVGQRLAGVPDSLLIMDPGAGHKKRSFFRKHKKTPSSPARLVTHLAAELQREKVAMASRGSSASSVCQQDVDMNHSFSNSGLNSRMGSDLNLQSPLVDNEKTPVVGGKFQRGDLSLDTTNASLRRGKPNTLKMGLHEYNKRRSLDIDTLNDEEDEDHHGHGIIESVPNTIDTSPIPKDCGAIRCSPEEIDVDNCTTPKCHLSDLSGLSRHSSQISMLSHQSSKTSLLSQGAPMESGLDQAFINESVLCGDTTHFGDTGGNETMDKTARLDTDCSQSMDCTDSAAAEYSVKYKCIELSSVADEMDSVAGPAAGSAKTATRACSQSELVHQHSVDSIDSAVDTTDPDELRKSISLHSIQSYDSGLDIHNDKTTEPSARTNQHAAASKLIVRSDSNLVPQSGKCKVRRRSAEPNLQISADMHNMLSKAGRLDTSSVTVSQATDSEESQLAGPPALRESVLELQNAGRVSAGRQQFKDTETDSRKESPLRFSNSMMRRNPNASPVRIPTIFAKNDKEANHYRELAKQALSSNSKTASIRTPKLPISTNLVRGNMMDKKLLPKSLLQMRQVEGARTPENPEGGADSTAGHTPARSAQTSMRVISFDEKLNQGSDNVSKYPLKNNHGVNITIATDSVPAKPKIRASLLGADSNYKLVNKTLPSGVSAVDAAKKYRSPMKPVKRLQSSPISPHGRRSSRSPRRLSTSPHRTNAASSSTKPHGMSPLPTQDRDWNI